MIEPRLPEAAWRRADGLQHVVATLGDAHGGPRFVGGAVRDALLGLDVSDVDLATTLLPQEVIDRLETANIKAVPTGVEHGTVTAVADGRHYEITTLRRDVATDGRRAVVAFSADWHEDAARRDFTINGLYADPATGEIFDYFGGLADLHKGTVRFIGDADARIAEDYLRILRYFRFFARFGKGPPDPDAIVACAAAAPKMTALSRERIAQEVTRLLLLPDPTQAVATMISHGIFAPFLPEIAKTAVGGLQRLIQRELANDRAPSLAARLLSILPIQAKTVDDVAARLKLSNRLRESLAARLSAGKPGSDNVRAIAYRFDPETARDAVMLFADDAELPACLAQLDDWDVPQLPVKGGDLIAAGLSAGPLVAKTLQAIERAWVAENFPPPERVDEIVRQAISEATLPARKA